MLILAITTTWEKLHTYPPRMWINLGLGIAAFFVAYLVVRKASSMNRTMLSFIVFLFLFVLGFHWIYERNEPRFMTPIVNEVVPFLPIRHLR